MIRSIFGLIGLVLTQNNTVSVFLPGFDTFNQSIMASVISSDATATTYALQCASSTDSNDCCVGTGVTLTQGPATVAFTEELSINSTVVFTGYDTCSIAGTTSAVCVESIGGAAAVSPGTTTTTYTGSDFTSAYMPITITAGPKITGSSSSSSTGTNISGSEASSTGGAQSTSFKTSTAGVPAVMGNTNWVLGIAAVAIVITV